MRNILFKDALIAVMEYLENCQGKESVYQLITKHLIEKFELEDFIEAERLLNLMIQHGYMNRKDSFFTILISATQKSKIYYPVMVGGKEK